MQTPDSFILAGGRSSRMGERKEKLLFGDKTFLRNAFDVLNKACGGNITIVGDVSSDVDFANVLTDEPPDGVRSENRAAIIGLYTALTNSRTDWSAILACDLPFVSHELLTRLWNFAGDEFDVVVPVQQDGRLQPLCAFYRGKNILSKLSGAIENGKMSLHGFLDQLSVRRVEFAEIADLADADLFFQNINTPEDYQLIQHLRSA